MTRTYKILASSSLFVSIFFLFLCCKVASDVITPPNSQSLANPSKLVKKIDSQATAIEWTRDKSIYGDKPVDVYMVRMNVDKTGDRANASVGEIKIDDLHFLQDIFLDGVLQSAPPLANMGNVYSTDFSAPTAFLANKNDFGFFPNMNNGNLETLKQKFSGTRPTGKVQQLTKSRLESDSSSRRKMFRLYKEELKITYIFDKPFKAAAWGDHCIVWIPAEDFDTYNGKIYKINDLVNPVSGKTIKEGVKTNISQSQCDTIRDSFENMYPYLTAMFGSPSKNILYPNGSTMDMEYFSDVANFVNILVYDLEVSGSSSDFGFVNPVCYSPALEYIGYRDVSHLQETDAVYNEKLPTDPTKFSIYQQAAMTNMCNLLHINTRMVFDSSGKVDSECLITVAHEYMHTLQYARKVIEGHQQLYSYLWSPAFGEMLGVLCEDVMGEFFNIPPEKSVLSRLIGGFMSSPFMVGMLGYTNDAPAASYSNGAAFGVFLTRNFGGPKLLGEMVKNKYDGWEAIIKAIEVVAGKKYTKESLMRDFCESLVCKNSAFNTNKPSARLNVNGKELVMRAVNMFDLTEYFPNKDPKSTVNKWLFGVELLNPYTRDDYSQSIFRESYHLRPDGGIQISLLAKKTTASTIKANFEMTQTSDPDEIIYIMIDEAR